METSNIDLGMIISQLPNFLGLLIAIYSQWRVIQELQGLNKGLIDVIVKRENCPPESDQAA